MTAQNFDWADNTLFFDEIPKAADPQKTAIFLAARDIIIDAPVSPCHSQRDWFEASHTNDTAY
jgi:hypothetical protein